MLSGFLCSDKRMVYAFFFFFQAEDGIRDVAVTGVQTCALPIFRVNPWLRLLPLLHEDAAGLLRRAADRQAINFYCRNTNADGYGLAVFSAGTNTFIEFEIVADHGDPRQHIWAVADQSSALNRRRDLAIFDEISFRSRKHEFSIRDVDLPASEVHGVKPAFHRTHDVVRVIFTREHIGISHARHGDMLVTLAASVAGIGNAHQLG